MARRKIPQDTEYFHYHNQNPKGRVTTDCVVRALSLASGIPYNQVVRDLAEIQCQTGYDDGDDRVYGSWLESHGFVRCKQPRKEDNTRYTGKEFCNWLDFYKRKADGNLVAHIGTHHLVAIIPTCEGDGMNDRFKVCDTWNSTSGCIGKYWMKKGD